MGGRMEGWKGGWSVKGRLLLPESAGPGRVEGGKGLGKRV